MQWFETDRKPWFKLSCPYANRLGFDGIAQSMCGNTYLSGGPEKSVKFSVNWAGYATALYSFSGLMAALMHKSATGEGQLVKTNLLHSALAFFHVHNMEKFLTDINRQTTHNRNQNTGPADIFETRDGHIILDVIGRPLFERWAKFMGEDHWLEDSRFSSDDAREKTMKY